ncbi:hypothetical protein [Radicibacter daui]|uniref:hypothetical protein n=1 Tax=Radicibacter daui TaxID=3064829 RepID=UPI004046DD89
MNVTVGGRRQIETATLQVPSGEDAWVEFSVDGIDIKINVKFATDDRSDGGRFEFTSPEGYGVLTIYNLNSNLPMSSMNPFLIWSRDGREILINFSGYDVQGFKFLVISFFWGGRHE